MKGHPQSLRLQLNINGNLEKETSGNILSELSGTANSLQVVAAVNERLARRIKDTGCAIHFFILIPYQGRNGWHFRRRCLLIKGGMLRFAKALKNIEIISKLYYTGPTE